MSEGTAHNKSAGVGSVLSATRESQGLSVVDVARQLKLGVRQIEALEADDYKSLPRITFVRGFIRNYAKLLRIDAEPLLKPTEHLLTPPQVPEAGPGVAEIPTYTDKKNTWGSYALFVLFAALGVMYLGYGWYREQEAPRPKPVTAAVKPLKSKPPVTQVKPQPAITENTIVPGDVPTFKQADEAAPVAQPIRSGEIRLEFDQESWVEITDKSGKTLLSQLNLAGSVQTVRGHPPFMMVVGNSVGVRIAYNGEPVDLQPYTKVDVARITLE